MREVVLDTSVVVKWFAQEKNSDKAATLLNEIVKSKLHPILPEIILAEIANALRYNKNFQKEETEEIINKFLQLEVSFVPIEKIIQETIATAYQLNLAIYDTLFVTLAEQLDIVLITADYLHHKKEYSKRIYWLSELNITEFLLK